MFMYEIIFDVLAGIGALTVVAGVVIGLVALTVGSMKEMP